MLTLKYTKVLLVIVNLKQNNEICIYLVYFSTTECINMKIQNKCARNFLTSGSFPTFFSFYYYLTCCCPSVVAKLIANTKEEIVNQECRVALLPSSLISDESYSTSKLIKLEAHPRISTGF